MIQYQRGQKIRYRARDELKKEGFHVMIANRSSELFDLDTWNAKLELFDLIAWNAELTRFIQIRYCKNEKCHFKPGELLAIVQEWMPWDSVKEIWIWLENRDWRKWRFLSSRPFPGRSYWIPFPEQKTLTKSEEEQGVFSKPF